MKETWQRCHKGGTVKSIVVSLSFVIIVFLSLFFACGVYAQSIFVTPDKGFEKKVLKVPYAFYNEAYGAAAGFVYGVTGAPQDQAVVVVSAVAGTEGSYALFLLERNIQVPFIKRLFIDTDLVLSKYGDLRVYTNGNPDFPDERAGSNESDEDNYIEGDGSDHYLRLKLKYLLPLGHGKNEIIPTQVLDRGLLKSGEVGGTSWNPLESGRTYLEARIYYRKQDVNNDLLEEGDDKTRAIELSLYRDNTDLPINPSKGSSLRLKFSRDWGGSASSAPWTVLDGEFSKYVSLGEAKKFRQRVIALNFWTANALTWNDSHEEDGKPVFHRPPPYAGASLGGIFRMRGFASSRFSDKAAIYYAAEYRMTPRWNPFEDIGWVKKYLDIAWWQWVPFAEVGRVAPSWSLSELHSSMKWDVGFGVRAMAKGLVVRIDTSVSKEEFGVQMMVGHPFPF
ncbi:MAG: BamA/TamA family outer membrane protein [Nitrospira sp.]|nr:BamA/TamA family outer membrane protein [Nitrospira sp.]